VYSGLCQLDISFQALCIIKMPRSQNTRLASRIVSISVDDVMLFGDLTLSLASQRLKPSVDLLTELVARFTQEEMMPHVQAVLESVGKVGCSLYVPGSGVPWDVSRIITTALQLGTFTCAAAKHTPRESIFHHQHLLLHAFW
jgi:hypothetical protein